LNGIHRRLDGGSHILVGRLLAGLGRLLLLREKETAEE
jgi:hypothetical protein